jgi:hypothetical protein
MVAMWGVGEEDEPKNIWIHFRDRTKKMDRSTEQESA